MPRAKRDTPVGGRSAPPARRIPQILEILGHAYPNARCELDFRTPLELLVATILSAQCTDARVNKVTATLFTQYHSVDDYAHADPAALEEAIRPTGFFRNKTKSIIACAQALLRQFGGKVPRSMEDLTSLPGVGRKTASIVLYHAYGVPGFAVDTHVARVTNRLGLVATEDPDAIEAEITARIPPAEWGPASDRFIFHGRRTCHARTPACPTCAVRALCPWPDKTA
jgi:endonuclease III